MGIIRDTIESKVAATATAAATGGSSAAHLFGFIPDDIGKLGIALGAVLSVTLIISHIRKTIIEYKKGMLEIKKLKEEIRMAQDDTNDC